jgi:hypothetical protein
VNEKGDEKGDAREKEEKEKGDALISSGEAGSGNLKNKCVAFSRFIPFSRFEKGVKRFTFCG